MLFLYDWLSEISKTFNGENDVWMVPPEGYCSMLLGSLCKQPLKHALQQITEAGFETANESDGPSSQAAGFHDFHQYLNFCDASYHRQFPPYCFSRFSKTLHYIMHFDIILKPFPYFPHKDSLQCCQLT